MIVLYRLFKGYPLSNCENCNNPVHNKCKTSHRFLHHHFDRDHGMERSNNTQAQNTDNNYDNNDTQEIVVLLNRGVSLINKHINNKNKL